MHAAPVPGSPYVRLPLAPALPLRTERLLLRAFTPADESFIWDVYSRPETHRWLYSEALTRERLPELLAQRVAASALAKEGVPMRFAVVVAETGTVVGDVALMAASLEHARGEIGFVFHPDHGGRGYATEAAARMLQLGFEEAGFHRIIGRLEARNEGSARVMERLGMRREATLVENEWVKGAWESETVYALLAREWWETRGG